ncbi:DUF6192 family protein [Nonomuraea indica]|uniref:DUF6192 family protein n=1 Tax=Nonomuraea indica TaxID=1581193 RepID=UPI001C5D252C
MAGWPPVGRPSTAGTRSRTTFTRRWASLRDDEERWERITKPPLDKRTQTHRWTDTAAKQAVDQKFADTTSVQQKVERIHDLARDEQVAAAVATDLLRRPEVAFKAMTDTTARHLVNRAQVDQARQAGEVVRERTPRCPGSNAAATFAARRVAPCPPGAWPPMSAATRFVSRCWRPARPD